MKDEFKTKEQLLTELAELRRRTARRKTPAGKTNQLKDSNEKFIKAFMDNSIPMTLNTLDDARFVAVNAAFLQFTGMTGQEVIGGTPTGLGYIAEEQRSLFFAGLHENGRVDNLEMQIKTKSGKIRYGLFNAVIISIKKENYLLVVIHDNTERRLAEDALQESEEFLHTIVANTPDLIFSQDLELRYTFLVNPPLGFTAADMIGKTDHDILPREEAARLTAVKRQVLETGQAQNYATFLTSRAGIPQFFDGTYVPRYDARGKVNGLIGYFRNLTERKLADDALKVSEENYRSIFQNAPVGIFHTLPEGKFLRANPALARMLRYDSPEELLAAVTDIGSQLYVDRGKRDAVIAAIMETRGLVGAEVRYRRKDGSVMTAQLSAHRIAGPGGNADFLEGFIEDITERKLAEEELKISEQKYRTVVESSGHFIMSIDKQGRYKFTNHLYAAYYGQTPGYFLGKTLWDVYPPEQADRRYRLAQRVFATGAGESLEVEVPEPGHSLYYHVQASPVKDESGQVIQMVLHLTDITDRKMAEAQKARLADQERQLQKAASLGRMAGAIAHHFNNRLSVVIGNLDIAAGKVARGENITAVLDAALQSSLQAAEISRMLVTYLGQSFEELGPLDLAEICRRSLPVLESVSRGKAMLETVLPVPGPTIKANADQLRQIITNLVTNALEAIDKSGGTIHLNVRTVSPAAIPVALRFPLNWQPQDSGYGCLEVTDTGCGIAKKDLENIFDPFYSSKFTGRGLGLAVVMGLVRAHGGVITVESKLGRGSAFRVFFPVVDGAAG